MLTIHALYQQNQRQLTELQVAYHKLAAQTADLKAANDKIARLTEQLEAERAVSRNRDKLIGVIEAERDTQRAEAGRLRGKHGAASKQITDAHSELDRANVARVTLDGVTLTLAERIRRLVPEPYAGPVRKFPCEDKSNLAKGA